MPLSLSGPRSGPPRQAAAQLLAVAFSAAGSAPLQATSARTRRRRVCSTAAHSRAGLVCLRRGTFHRRKVPKMRRGAAAPGPPWSCAACIPRRGIAQAVTLHRALPFHTACPFPASRGPVESASRYGYRSFLKGRTPYPGTGRGIARGSFYVHSPATHRRGAHRASGPRQRPLAKGATV